MNRDPRAETARDGRPLTPAVVLSSHMIGLAVIRALGMMGVRVTSVYYQDTDMGYVSRYVDKRVRAPHPEREEQAFLTVLAEQADPRRKAVLIPADDATLATVSRHKRWLESYYVVGATDASIAEKIIDKKHTYELAAEIGVPAPRTFVPHAIQEAVQFASDLGFPCLVKPRRSHQYYEIFKRKMVKVNTAKELLEQYRAAEAAGQEVLIQELIPGDDGSGVNYNSFRSRDGSLVEFTAEKVRLSPPGFGVPRVVVSKSIAEIAEPGRKFLSALAYYGFSCTEFKRDARDGRYKLMEVNGRHNLSGLLALRCGVNFPWIEYQHLLGNGLQRPAPALEGVYWIDEFKDVVQSVQLAKTERYRLADYLRPYLKPHTFAIFSLADPRPFLKRWLDVGRLLLRRLGRPSSTSSPGVTEPVASA